MALVKRVVTAHGGVFDRAYIKIGMVRILPPNTVTAVVETYVSEDARRSDKAHLDITEVRCEGVSPLPGETYVGAVYRAIKALPEYADADDDFEEGQQGGGNGG